MKACEWSKRVLWFVPDERRLAENIAAGASTPQEVVDGWMRSPVHRRNVLGAALHRARGRLLGGRERGFLLGCGLRWPVRRDSPAVRREKWGSASIRPCAQSLALARSTASLPRERARSTSCRQGAWRTAAPASWGLPSMASASSRRESVDIQGLAAHGTTAMLLGQQLLAPLEVGRGGLTLGEPPVGLVERHPLPVLLGLALAGRKRRQALVVEGNAVPLAVGGNPGPQLLVGEPWSAAVRAVEARSVRGRGFQRLAWGRRAPGRWRLVRGSIPI